MSFGRLQGKFNGLRKRREAMTDSNDMKNTAKPLLQGLGKKVLHSVRAAVGCAAAPPKRRLDVAAHESSV